MIVPPPLRAGAAVALVAPAGPLPAGAVDRALERVRALGWEPRLGPHAEGRHGFLSAPDHQRLADLQAALDDPSVHAIWCLRGGYGTMRILERIDWRAALRTPKPLIGFSDNTALLLAARRQGLVAFHGPHAGAAEFPDFTRESLLRAVANEPGGQRVLPVAPGGPLPRPLRAGIAAGPLVGGNLSLLASTVGTPVQANLHGAILFLEEVAEPVYRVDRMLSQLLLAGLLDGVAGIAVGAFSEAPDAGDPGLPSVHEVLLDRLDHLGVPILADLPFGHVAETWTLPHGAPARLDADAGTLTLLPTPDAR